MKTTPPDKMDIASVKTIENNSNANNSPSITESKTSTYTKETKINEDNINVS